MTDTNTMLPYVRLQFEIENPSLEECYAYGYQAAMAEQGEDINPYKEDTVEYQQWQEGWWAGFYGEQPLYPMNELFESQDDVVISDNKPAANDKWFIPRSGSIMSRVARVTSAIAATAIVGYQVIDLVA